MRVLYVTAELFPWVKSGGLGDVAAALPPALIRHGVDLRLLLPGFPGFLDAFAGLADVARVRTPFARERVRIALTQLPEAGGLAYIVDHPPFYDRDGGPYADASGRDWPDNHLRFGLFGWAAAALARGADPDWRPDIVHGHDWHAGLGPAYLAAEPPRPRVATLFTIHNLAYRGLFPVECFAELALPAPFFAVEGVEFYGQVSFLKAGIAFSDRLTTVSPTYAREIQTPAFGCGLDGLLRHRAGALSGILHGVDPQVWDPAHDRLLPRTYGIDDATLGKQAAKQALQAQLRLDGGTNMPLFGVVSRLTPQKGLDLLLAALPALIAADGQLGLLGAGDADLEQGFAEAAAVWPGRVGVEFGYDEELAHRIVAGADLVVMPSRYEPCGLTQLYALRYGTLPLVRQTGGLADTVVDATAATLANGTATGFVFAEESPPALAGAIEGAARLYRQPAVWRAMMRRAMTRDFSWDAAADRYLALYETLTHTPASEPKQPLPSR